MVRCTSWRAALSVRAALLVAIVIEAWAIVENAPTATARSSIALGYSGDSIVNNLQTMA